MEKLREALAARLRTENSVVRELMAEFAGTFLLLLFGISTNIQATFSMLSANVDSALAAQLGAQLGWAFAFALAFYSAAQISGAHLNPAISLAHLFCGGISPLRFLLYIPAQLFGAFFGSALAFLGHFEDCMQIRFQRGDRIFGFHEQKNNSIFLASQFATYPRQGITVWGSIADQLIGTAILAAALWLITDKRHQIPAGLVPMLAGLTMAIIALTFGLNGGFAINPARDLGPRLFLLCIGMGWGLFSHDNFYFWIPLVIPFVGALVGAFAYNLFIGIHGLDEEVAITGAKYPRDDRGYKEYTSNPAAIGATGQLISYSSALSR